MAIQLSKSTTACAAAVLVGLAAPLAVPAQSTINVPFSSLLPDHDFVWTWGGTGDPDRRGRPDIDIKANDTRFRCELTAEYAVGNRLSIEEMRNLETGLQTSISFIETTYYTMGQLEWDRTIDWATLDCKLHEITESKEATQERMDKALERAQRKRDRRRAADAKDEEQ